MDGRTHHPATNDGGDSDHNTPKQPMHHVGDAGSHPIGTGPHFGDVEKTTQPMQHGGDSGPHQMGAGSHTHDIEDFKKRFIISTILTIPILLLSPVIQSFFGFQFDIFGSPYITLALASIIYMGGIRSSKGFSGSCGTTCRE